MILFSVAYVSRSGGMSNELNNIISRNTNGVVEGVAIGGDRYPGTTFMDHLIRYQNDADVSTQYYYFCFCDISGSKVNTYFRETGENACSAR